MTSIIKRSLGLLLYLFGAFGMLKAQESRVSGTLKVFPWVNAPVVLSTDIQGGMQSLGTINFSTTPLDPSDELNPAVPGYKRLTGMIVSAIDLNSQKTRYFEYDGTNIWHEISFGTGTYNGNRTITRTGLPGITGQNFGTETIADFLDKVFFPVLSPYITSFRYNTNIVAGQYSYQTADPDTKVVTNYPGTVTFPYSSWSTSSTLIFNYDIAKRDASSPIVSVELIKGGAAIATNFGDVTSGSFANVNTADFVNVDATQNVTLTLKVTFNTTDVVSLDLNTSFTKANGVGVSNVRLATTSSGSAITSEGSGTSGNPYLLERTGSEISNYLVWSLTGNDDVGHITDIYFSGTPSQTNLSGTNLTNTYISPITFPHADASTVYQLGVSAKGSIANDVSSVAYTSYYKLQDKLYCGYSSSWNVAPTEAQIKGLQQSSLATTNYYNSGVTLTNNTGSSGFLTWAVPTYVDGNLGAPAFSKTAYYFATGQWFANSNVEVHYVKVSAGATSSWYWVCIYKDSTSPGGSMTVKIG